MLLFVFLQNLEKNQKSVFLKMEEKEVEVGDTDTNAAIAGALLGAYYGLENIASDKITRKNIKTVLRCDAASESKTDIVRPPHLNMKTILF